MESDLTKFGGVLSGVLQPPKRKPTNRNKEIDLAKHSRNQTATVVDEERIRKLCREKGRVYHAPTECELPDAPTRKHWGEYKDVIFTKEKTNFVQVLCHPYGKAFSRKTKGNWQLRELITLIDRWIAKEAAKVSQPKRPKGRPPKFSEAVLQRHNEKQEEENNNGQ